MEQAEARDTAFARALRRAIATRGWSHRAAGEALGVSHTQIGRYLTGADPSLSTAARLATVLEVSVDRLAGIEQPSSERASFNALAKQIVAMTDAQIARAEALRRAALLLADQTDEVTGRGTGADVTAEALAALQEGEEVALDAEAAAQRERDEVAGRQRQSA